MRSLRWGGGWLNAGIWKSLALVLLYKVCIYDKVVGWVPITYMK